MILHLDMDAFFASVEQMDNPGLRGRPVIVGGAQRGVVATASYEARVYGVHSAMPIATARKLCPHGVFLRGRDSRYVELSKAVMAALAEFSPVVQPASIDEAYADLTGLERLHDSPLTLALAIQARVAEVTAGLTCSIGIAPVKFLAKICSDINKPNGVYILEQASVDAFLRQLPVEKLPGVGAHMSASLRAYGIATVRQLRQLSRQFLLDRFGKWGGVLHDRALGIDPRAVHERPPPKSEGAERTFVEDVTDKAGLLGPLKTHAEKVGISLRKQGLAGRTITLKIKYADFRQITRCRTLRERVDSTEAIFQAAASLLAAERLSAPVRLIGVSVSGFEARPEQLTLPGLAPLLEEDAPRPDKRARALDQTLDALRERFGKQAIRRGAGEAAGTSHHFE